MTGGLMADLNSGPPYPVRLVPSGKETSCPADQSLLDSCIQAGIPVPYNCRSGECGECMASLLSGRVHELPGADPAVFTDAHRREGNILTCMCFPRSPITLDLPLQAEAPSIRPDTFNVMVQRVERLTPTIFGVTVETPWPIEYRAGQCFEWVLPGIAPNRKYSAANPPGDDHIDFHVRIYPGGKVGDFLAGTVLTGQAMQLIGPFGNFGLSSNQWRPAVCVAGGTGLAPILASLENAFAHGDTRPIRFFFGARRQHELYCLDKLQSWSAHIPNFSYVPVLSEEPAESGWTGKRGLVTGTLAQELGDVFGLEAYICGPPAMIDAAHAVLEESGVPPEDIRSDRFVQARS
jgi:xylene monooxygenase electron transfer component